MQTDVVECLAYTTQFNLSSFLGFNASNSHACQTVCIMPHSSFTRQLVLAAETLLNNHPVIRYSRAMDTCNLSPSISHIHAL